MSNDPLILKDEKTGDQYRLHGPWYPTQGRHGDMWNFVGDLTSCLGKRYSLHKLGSLNRFRAIDNQHPYTQHYCELTYVYTPT
jgi:hypothetical protein